MKDAAIGIVYSSDKARVLILKRRDAPVWVLPGGGIEEGESPEQAVVREVREETGLGVEIVRKVGEYAPINRLSKFVYAFECRVVSGTMSTGDETREILFKPIKHLPKSFFILHREWLAEALENKSEPIIRPNSTASYFQLFKHLIQHPYWLFRFAITKVLRKE